MIPKAGRSRSFPTRSDARVVAILTRGSQHALNAVFRPAAPADAKALSGLLAELGYPAGPDEIPPRLRALEEHPAAMSLVAELDGRVVGIVTAHVIPAIHVTTPVALLTVLAVAEGARGRGIGRQLVLRAEEWARARGAVRISLTSGLHREGAHAFYETLGYERTGLRLTKSL